MKFLISTIASSVVFVVGAGHAFATPDPSVAKSPTPPVQYKSPLKDYRPLGEDKRIPWRAANDEVGKIGGWRVYLREVNEAVSTPANSIGVSPPQPTAPVVPPPESNVKKPMPSDHAGHGQPK